jgi:hypothetical protein
MTARNNPWLSASRAEIEATAAEYFAGTPNKRLSSAHELRFGKKGSISVQISGPKAGHWYNFEDDRGGYLPHKNDKPGNRQQGSRKKSNGTAECTADGAASGTVNTDGDEGTGAGAQKDNNESEANTAQRESNEQARRERAEKIAWCRQEWERAVAIEGTLAERYFTEHRCLRAPWPSGLRYSSAFRLTPNSQPKPAVVAAVSNTENEIVALHAIYLDPQTGRKAPDSKGRAKFSYGPVNEGSVVLRGPGQARALVIAEGIETGLTRWLVGPADIHICAGNVRMIEPANHHTRVEVIADADKVKKARQLARKYDANGRKAYTVTVPKFLGDTADLNDLLLLLGESAVMQAVEDAERIRSTKRDPSDYHLSLGSDVEIAHMTLEILEDVYGPVIVAEGQIWAFAHTHFAPLDSARLRRLVHQADGAFYPWMGSSTRRARSSRAPTSPTTHNQGVLAVPEIGPCRH